ncbi:hypothetical protein G5C66_03995 [Nocardioides sp. KC13]|uniref:Uncharacterized protein n=1 Tax=Nocardioides turkmenicus TaxID=2711220 RepID=A0A6M1QVV2_9ACTN|nr:hypothetical protein [Nocardioides sp. KC13]NGN91896.1 hypothetical protein [Nocardioides sp. KC13]
MLTETQQHRLTELFAADAHVEVEAAWGIYQRMIAGYVSPTEPDYRIDPPELQIRRVCGQR